MNELIVTIVAAVLGSSALHLIVQAIIDKRKEERQRPVALEEGMKLLLQDRIRMIALAALDRGETTTAERKYISEAYEVYHQLPKANGEMARLINDYNALPIDYFKEAG